MVRPSAGGPSLSSRRRISIRPSFSSSETARLGANPVDPLAARLGHRLHQIGRLGVLRVEHPQIGQAVAGSGVDLRVEREGHDLLFAGRAAVQVLEEAELRQIGAGRGQRGGEEQHASQ